MATTNLLPGHCPLLEKVTLNLVLNGPAASASPRSSLEMQIPSPSPTLTDQKLEGGAQ